MSDAPVRLTHLDETGAARMVDVASKDVTVRTARASGRVLLSAQAVAALRDGRVPKGDALAVARIAGIAGAKRTPDLIPLCHPLGLHGVSVDVTVEDWGVAIEATVRTADRTGVEMEALTSVSVAALTLIDMIKSVDKGAVITDVRLESKDGGKSGPWQRTSERRAAPGLSGATSEGSRRAAADGLSGATEGRGSGAREEAAHSPEATGDAERGSAAREGATAQGDPERAGSTS
jgi:cyclic pyranopterin phosphate synthase